MFEVEPKSILLLLKKKVHRLDIARFIALSHKIGEINHPHLLKYHRLIQSRNSIGIIMEHPGGGTLREYLLLRPERRISERETLHFFRQILGVVECLFKHSICHRNLNLRNIFVDRNGNIKVGDFLLCSKVEPIYKPNSTTSSYHFYAPEIWQQDGRSIGPSADIWSMGVLLYVMTCGSYPFVGRHEFDIFLSVKHGRFTIPSHLSKECSDLITLLLQPRPSERPSLVAVKKHPWYLGSVQERREASPPINPGGGPGGGPGGVPNIVNRALLPIPEEKREETMDISKMSVSNNNNAANSATTTLPPANFHANPPGIPVSPYVSNNSISGSTPVNINPYPVNKTNGSYPLVNRANFPVRQNPENQLLKKQLRIEKTLSRANSTGGPKGNSSLRRRKNSLDSSMASQQVIERIGSRLQRMSILIQL